MITIWKTPIVATVEQVLKDLKLQLYGAGLLKEIKNTGSDLMCTCPFHANGKEHNPSCGVLLQQKVTKDKTYEAGTVHCYTCGYTADLPQFVADLLGLSSPVEGFKWLVNQYNYQTEERELPDLDMYRGSTAKSSVLEESLVKQYTQNLLQSEEACRYLHKRRIANWVLEAYELGFDPEDKTVLFPVRGMDGKVIFYKGRSIAGKHFYNAKEVDKTSVVFGLWEILNGSFSWGTSDQIEEVWITESEIDALSLISYGVPAVGVKDGETDYDFPIYEVHKLDVDGSGRDRTCLCKGEGCEFCKSGNKPQLRMFLQMINKDEKDKDKQVQLWERGLTDIKNLIGLAGEYGDLTKRDIKIKRSGAKGSLKTTYQYFPKDPSEMEIPEPQNLVGSLILDLDREDQIKAIEGRLQLNKGNNNDSNNDSGAGATRVF